MSAKSKPQETPSSGMASNQSHATPQQSYYQATQPKKPRFLTPKTFRSAINARLDNPSVSLFRLGTRVLQFCLALVAGISYGIELGRGNVGSDGNTPFIYAQVVFALTLIVLIIDTMTVRSYHMTWMVEWLLTVLWIALFGTFYTTYYTPQIEPQYAGVDINNMKRIVWVDLVSALLWMASALFSTTLCCSGVRAKIRGKTEDWKLKRKAKKQRKDQHHLSQMEEGTIGSQAQGERLPQYDEIPLEDRN